MSDSFANPWSIACQSPLSMGFPRQEDWSGLPFPSPGDLPDLGIEPAPPALTCRFFTTEPPGNVSLQNSNRQVGSTMLACLTSHNPVDIHGYDSLKKRINQVFG